MKVYCAGALRGDTGFQESYREIIRMVEFLGHTVFSELASDYKGDVGDDRDIYRRDMKWLDNADILIAELSGLSLGVGYELSYALHICQIPVLGLYHQSLEKISAMITGNDHPKLHLETYGSLVDLRERIQKFLTKIRFL